MIDRAAEPKRVLVTGSTGAIGAPLALHLAERGHTVRGFARRPTPGISEFVEGDLADRDAVRRAVEGTEAIVHLGAYPNPADFVEVLLGPNVLGLYHICEAAVEHGVQRLVLASTVQTVTGHRFRDRPVRIEDGPAPVNHYALTKVWAEVTGEMYARVHNLSVISVRIGWLPRNTEEAKRLAASEHGRAMFFSHEDSKRFFTRCVESADPQSGGAVILNARRRAEGVERRDLEAARRVIGYEAQNVWPEGLPFPIA